MNKILILENTDFQSFPVGGTLSFDKQLLSVLEPNEVCLAGLTTNPNQRLGRWSTIEIEGKLFDFFPFMYVSKYRKKPFIPLRLQSLFYLFFRIRKLNEYAQDVFTQTPQFLFLLQFYKWRRVCFCFAGLGNSVGLSRYKILRGFGGVYENILIGTLKRKVDIILAAADKTAISNFKELKRELKDKEIISFPTRFNQTIFKPMDKDQCRKELGLEFVDKIVVVLGRLSWVKGWDLAVEMMEFAVLHNLKLIFVGDGESRPLIEERAKLLIDSGNIIITGFVPPDLVSKYLNACDLSLVVSYQEGWSTSILEAIACGKPVVSTDVSSARELIINGHNGYILPTRDPLEMWELIKKAFKLKDVKQKSLRIASKFSLNTLRSDFLEHYKQF